MTELFVCRGFCGRRQPDATARRLPPGQYETRNFPVLSAGPTPHTTLATWDFMVRGPAGPVATWAWDEFEALPHETVTADFHCVTKWSKLDTVWEGVSAPSRRSRPLIVCLALSSAASRITPPSGAHRPMSGHTAPVVTRAAMSSET